MIHAGIYYPTGSLKAKLCVSSKDSLYRYLKERSIPHQQCGKLIVASSEAEIPKLHKIFQQAISNGVDLQMIDSDEVKAMEPAVKCMKALHSPYTGIFDSHQYMINLQSDAEAAGTVFVYNCSVLSGNCISDKYSSTDSLDEQHRQKLPQNQNGKVLQQQHQQQQQKEEIVDMKANNGIILETTQGPIQADIVINASGLHSIQFVEHLHGYPRSLIPKAYYSKGNYFDLKCSTPFKRLIYPIPEVGGLGIHATIDLSGAVRFGPDVEWLKEERNEGEMNSNLIGENIIDDIKDDYIHRHSVPSDYNVDPSKAAIFCAAIKNYYPDIRLEDLSPAYSGFRPKLVGPLGSGQGVSSGTIENLNRDLNDFIIEGPKTHGVKGLINLFGIESPGLTSSLSIADYVIKLLEINSPIK